MNKTEFKKIATVAAGVLVALTLVNRTPVGKVVKGA